MTDDIFSEDSEEKPNNVVDIDSFISEFFKSFSDPKHCYHRTLPAEVKVAVFNYLGKKAIASSKPDSSPEITVIKKYI